MIHIPLRRGSLRSLVYSPDGKMLATGGSRASNMNGPGGLVQLWDISTGSLMRQLDHTHPFGVSAVSFSPNGNLLASGSGFRGEGSVGWHDLRTGTYTSLRSGYSDTYALAFHPSGRRLASGGSGLQVWDVSKKQEKRRLLDPLSPDATRTIYSEVYSLAFSPDGRTLAAAVSALTMSHSSASHNTIEIHLLDPARGRTRAVLTGHKNMIRSVAFSPDGRLLASASRDMTIKLWDMTTLAERSTLRHDSGRKGVGSVDFTPDGSALLSASTDGKVVVWDVATARRRETYDWGIGALSCVAVAPDGSTAAVTGKDGIVIWDLG